MAQVNTFTPPKACQRDRVRNQTWVVSDVQQDMADEEPSHLVDLVSIEDDGQGDELWGMWEIELGAEALAQGMFPTGVDVIP